MSSNKTSVFGRKRLNWELPKERAAIAVTSDVVLRAAYEFLRLALEWEAASGVKRAGLLDEDIANLRGTFDATEGEQRLLVAINVLLQRQDARREESLRARIGGIGIAVDEAFDGANGDEIVRAAGRGDERARLRRKKLREHLESVFVEHLRYIGVAAGGGLTPKAAEAVRSIVEHFTTTHRELKRRAPSQYKRPTKDSKRLLRFYDAFQRELEKGSFGKHLKGLKLSPSTMRNISKSLVGKRTAGQLGIPARAAGVHRDDDGQFDVLSTIVADTFRLIAKRAFTG